MIETLRWFWQTLLVVGLTVNLLVSSLDLIGLLAFGDVPPIRRLVADTVGSMILSLVVTCWLWSARWPLQTDSEREAP